MQNFGGNIEFHPAVIVEPRSEAEVLGALRTYRGRNVRVVGRLHSWSPAAATDDVLFNLRHLQEVVITVDEAGPLATIGAGCQVKRLIHELAAAGLAMPSLGLISEQTIAGATATGTHGSGRSSLSHYLCEVRVATYDERGEPVIRTFTSGDELRAARCSLGCLGVIVSVSVRPRAQYCIEEWFEGFATLEDVLAAEAETPLQQFYLLAWRWKYLSQRRRETSRRRSWHAPLYRAYFFLGIDVSLHLIIRALVQTVRSRRLMKAFGKHIAPRLVFPHWHVVDDSAAQLIMEHELFRHIEIEIFVRRSRLAELMDFVRELVLGCGGELASVKPETRARLRELELDETFAALAGNYVHHYPITVRRVECDDTLISMASGGNEDYYAVSFISYALPKERDGFFAFAALLAESTAALFQARPHWGKWCPLDAEQLARLYPRLEEFRAFCQEYDPQGVFANAWAKEKLGLA